MKKNIALFITFSLLLFFNHSVFAEEKQNRQQWRVVSLAPHLTEILFEIGAGSQIVGAVSYSDFPEAAKKIPNIGSYKKLNLEAILALKPDLIAGWESGNKEEELHRLQELGMKLHITEPRKLDDVPKVMLSLGKQLGREKESQQKASEYRKRIADLRGKYAHQKPLKVFYQVWNRPLITINGEQIISSVIKLCGGVNVFASLKGLAPRIGVEAVLMENPDVIIASGMGQSRPEWLDDWKEYTVLNAVQKGNLVHVIPGIIQRHGPRLVLGAEAICQALDQARQKM